mmetsp:Transcript_4232/g.12938  ORF Transcript_4232/g.12938 Transcript_4232/m.12938 type:complete len:880 (-) Transcript_4232:71-2710(-)
MSLINVSSSCAHTRTERTGTSRVCVDCGMVMDRFTELRSGGDAGVFETTFRPQFLTYNDEQNSIPRHLHQTHRSVPRSFIDSSSKYMRAQRRAHRTALAKAGRTTISMACRKRVQVEAMKLSRCLSLSAPVHRQLMKVIIAAYEHRWQTMQAPELLAGSLAYWVCRRNNQPIVMREVAAAVGVDPVRFGRFYLLVMRVMNLERCSTLPEAFVERVVSLLPNFRRDDPAIVNLLENVNTVMDTPECEALVDGRFPQALAIAAVLICYQEVVDQSRPLNYGIPVPLSTSSGSDESSADDEANGNINDSDEEKNSVSPGTRRRTTSSTSSVPSSRNANNHTALRSRKRFIRRWLASQLHVKVATVLKRERELRESLRAMAKQHLPWAKNIKYYSIDAHVPALLQHLRFLKQLPGTDGHSETEEESSPQADPAELQELDGCTSSDSGAESDDTLDCRPPPDSAGGTRSFDRRSVNLGSVDTSSVAMGTVDRRTADTAPVRVPSPSRVSPGERSSAPAQQSASQRQQPTVAPATSSALEQLDTKPFLIESRCLPPALVRLRRTQLQNAARSLAASERLAVLRKMSSEHGTAPSLPFHSGKEEEEHQQQQQQQQQGTGASPAVDALRLFARPLDEHDQREVSRLAERQQRRCYAAAQPRSSVDVDRLLNGEELGDWDLPHHELRRVLRTPSEVEAQRRLVNPFLEKFAQRKRARRERLAEERRIIDSRAKNWQEAKERSCWVLPVSVLRRGSLAPADSSSPASDRTSAHNQVSAQPEGGEQEEPEDEKGYELRSILDESSVASCRSSVASSASPPTLPTAQPITPTMWLPPPDLPTNSHRWLASLRRAHAEGSTNALPTPILEPCDDQDDEYDDDEDNDEVHHAM